MGQRGHCKSRRYFLLPKRKGKSSMGYSFSLYTTEQYQQLRDFVSDRMSRTVQRGRWFNIIIFNTHATSEEKSDD